MAETKIKIIPDERHVPEIKKLYGKELEATVAARIEANGNTFNLRSNEFVIVRPPVAPSPELGEKKEGSND